MKKRLFIGVYILGITLLVALLILPIKVKANKLSDDEKITVNISLSVPENFNSELRIRYYDTIGSLPDHIFIMSERSGYNINIRMLPGRYSYKSTEIDGVPLDENIYKISMPEITIVNETRSNKQFKGELTQIKEESQVVTITPDLTVEERDESEEKLIEENKYFGTMTEKEILEWYKEQMEKIISEDPVLSKITKAEWKVDGLLHFCSYSMKKEVKNTDDLMKKIKFATGGKDKETDYYKTIAKTYFYIYEEWQKGNYVDFVFEEEESNENNVEYTALVDELVAYDNIENHGSTEEANSELISSNSSDISDGLVFDDEINNTIENVSENISKEPSAVITNEAKKDSSNNTFLSFLKKGGFSFIVVIVVGAIWFIIKRKRSNI